DDYWKWLKLDGTQDGDPPPERILDHVVIEHADYGIYATYASNFNLTNSTVQNCLQNLYLSHSDAYIDGNVIANASGSAFNAHGIYLYSSSPSFYNNTISNNTVAGVYCYNYSSPEFGSSTSSTYGLNELNGNDHGIYANYYSNPFLGDTIPDTEGTYRLGGYNSIHDNASSAVKAVENCDIQAQYNWWGMYPVEAGIFDIEEGSTIDYANALTYDPVNDDPQSLTTGKINTTREMGSALMSGHQGFNPAGGENFTPRELLRLAKKLRIQQTPKLAIPVYKQLLTQYPNRVEARWGLIELISTFKEARLDSSVHFLRRLQNTHPSGKMIRIASDLLTVEHLQKKNASQAIANARQILTNYPNREKIALFDLLNIFLHFREDSLQAQGYLTQLEQKYPNDPLTWHGQMLLNSGGMST
ncbi:MAG: DUF1565 domain-containing protein, partial [Aliifodinibius sp.]|nr:DUF1565 domain-containing protein [Fodinibius sp.]NIV14642.1 DUF1565 domain-containing protein [Fodinibius sp.]NIY28536.1 DUF1565 domain-containing protein [Fodinibius sp.]